MTDESNTASPEPSEKPDDLLGARGDFLDLREAENGEWYLVWVAGNYEDFFVSETYTEKATAEATARELIARDDTPFRMMRDAADVVDDPDSEGVVPRPGGPDNPLPEPSP
jgi:uncharacterized protein YegP (UPF0339 family)